MKIALTICCLVQLIWFFGCIVTYRVGRRTLVDGMGVRSAEFVMFCLFAAGIALLWLFEPVGRWALPAVLLFWAVVQFFCHEYFTLFGASEKKLRGYNECFKDTIHLFPAGAARIVPDLYHILLHLLIVVNLTLSVLFLIRG